MPLQLIDNVGQLGIISDTQPEKLADGAWSNGQNVRFDGFVASKVAGSRYFAGSLSGSAYSLFAHTTFDGAHFFAYAGLTSVFTVNNNIHYDISRLVGGAYTTDTTKLWTGGVLGGLLFMNNGIDIPQIQLTPTASAHLANIPNWPTTVTTRCNCLRAYKNYLVALDVTKGAIRYRQMVKWSASAQPLTAPTSWDEADTTKDAGETSLSETNGTVVDCLPLRDINIIYKDDSVHGMQYIGVPFVFRFYQIFSSVGIIAKRCVAAFENYHCFIGNDLDIYVHDGNTIRSIADSRWRQYMRQNVLGSRYERMFMVANPVTSEIWVFIPTGSAQYTSKVLMWNWRKDTWGERDVANVSSAVAGGIESTDYVTIWSAMTTTWDTEGTTWAELESLPPDRKLVMCNPDSLTGLIETEYGTLELGANLPFMLERTGIWGIPTAISDGARVIDLGSVKFVRRIRFRTKDISVSDAITFKVAVQSDLNSPQAYASTNKLTNSTAEVTVLKRGAFLSIRIESTMDTLFSLQSVEIEVEPSGDYL